jgi:hypothetical protein
LPLLTPVKLPSEGIYEFRETVKAKPHAVLSSGYIFVETEGPVAMLSVGPGTSVETADAEFIVNQDLREYWSRYRTEPFKGMAFRIRKKALGPSNPVVVVVSSAGPEVHVLRVTFFEE